MARDLVDGFTDEFIIHVKENIDSEFATFNFLLNSISGRLRQIEHG